MLITNRRTKWPTVFGDSDQGFPDFPQLCKRQVTKDTEYIQSIKNILDFKLSPCFESSIYSFGYFPGVRLWFADVSEPSISSIFKGWMWSILHIQPMKMEQIECSETSAYNNLTPGKYPKEYILNKKYIWAHRSATCLDETWSSSEWSQERRDKYIQNCTWIGTSMTYVCYHIKICT